MKTKYNIEILYTNSAAQEKHMTSVEKKFGGLRRETRREKQVSFNVKPDVTTYVTRDWKKWVHTPEFRSHGRKWGKKEEEVRAPEAKLIEATEYALRYAKLFHDFKDTKEAPSDRESPFRTRKLRSWMTSTLDGHKKLFYVEMWSGKGRIAQELRRIGLGALQVGLSHGFNLHDSEMGHKLDVLLAGNVPEVMWWCPTCKDWCKFNVNTNANSKSKPGFREELKKRQDDERPALKWMARHIISQNEAGKIYVLEQPEGSEMLKERFLERALRKSFKVILCQPMMVAARAISPSPRAARLGSWPWRSSSGSWSASAPSKELRVPFTQESSATMETT